MAQTTLLEGLKIWLTFFVALFIGTMFIIITGFCWIVRQIVRILASIFKRRELAEMLNGLSRHLAGLEHNIKERPEYTVNIFLVLEGALELETLQRVIHDRVLLMEDGNGNLTYQRFQQFPTTWLGYDFFKWEKEFQISTHVKYTDDKLTVDTLHSFIASRSKMPFQKDTSMWEILVAKNYDEKGNTGLYFRFQHTLSDGMSLLKLFYTELSTGNDTECIDKSPPKASSIAPPPELPFWKNLYTNFICVPRRFVLENATHWYLPRSRDYTQFNQQFVETTNGINMDDLKLAKNKLGMSLTVLIASAISSAMSSFFDEVYDSVNGVKPDRVTTMFPFMLQTASKGKLTNHFGLGPLNLPLNLGLNPVTRMNLITQGLQEIPKSTSTSIFFIASKFLDHFPTCLYKKLMFPLRPQNVIHPGVTLTNVPGPHQATSFLNYSVIDMMFWIPTSVDFWILFAIFSYNGILKVGFSGSSQIIRNAENLKQISTRVESELLKYIADTK